MSTQAQRSSDKATPSMLGHAATWNVWTTLYKGETIELREIIRPGAFKEALREGQDVRLLYNHSRDYLLAREASRTLRLSEDQRGLRVEADLLDTQWVRDTIVAPASRNDLDGMSFAFTPRGPNGIRETRREDRAAGKVVIEWELVNANLHDVSIVVIPQYPESRFKIRMLTSSQRRKEFLMESALRLAEAAIV